VSGKKREASYPPFKHRGLNWIKEFIEPSSRNKRIGIIKIEPVKPSGQPVVNPGAGAAARFSLQVAKGPAISHDP